MMKVFKLCIPNISIKNMNKLKLCRGKGKRRQSKDKDCSMHTDIVGAVHSDGKRFQAVLLKWRQGEKGRSDTRG